jgi:hypothetical protein
LTVGSDLVLNDTLIQSLPKGVRVGSYLILNNTPIESLPKDLSVGGPLYLTNTPIGKKYSVDEIRKMVPKVQGIIKI